MSVAEQVNYESSVRFRYGVIAFCGALLIVASQLIQLSGVHASVNELTLDLVAANQRVTPDVIGATLDMLGLAAVGVLLYWLHRISSARRPELKPLVRWIASVGAGLSAVMALAYTIIVAHKAHQFVTTGNQGYPEANHLTSGGLVVALPLLLELGTLMLAIGCIWTSLSAMRVGLVTRMVGYVGVLSGALFLFPIGGLVPIVQGYWLAAIAVTLARRWPSGDPPAWASGTAVPWEPTQSQRARQDARGERAQRRRGRVSDTEVLAAVQKDQPKVDPKAGRAKRKRRR
jgi:hypothetical protein